jgi:hypothetical protein
MDRLQRGLGPGERPSRRQVLGGLVAAMAGTALATVGVTAKPNKVKPTPPGKNKVGICHFDAETGTYAFIQVPADKAKGHKKHTSDIVGVASADECPVSEPPAE